MRALTITVSNDPAVFQSWCANLLSSLHPSSPLHVGFDTESRPCFVAGTQTPVSVVQLALPDRVLVAHIGSYRAASASPGDDGLGPLRSVLTCAGVALVGMGSAADVAGLGEALGLPRGGGGGRAAAVELKRASERGGCAVPGGLLGLAQSLCGAEKWKSKQLQMSRWDVFPLTEEQAIYAALDAFWGGECFAELQRREALRAAEEGGVGGGGGGSSGSGEA